MAVTVTLMRDTSDVCMQAAMGSPTDGLAVLDFWPDLPVIEGWWGAQMCFEAGGG